jgi:hypothetical protein
MMLLYGEEYFQLIFSVKKIRPSFRSLSGQYESANYSQDCWLFHIIIRPSKTPENWINAFVFEINKIDFAL